MCFLNNTSKKRLSSKVFENIDILEKNPPTIKSMSDIPVYHFHHNSSSTRKTKVLQPGFTAKNHVRHFVQHDYHDHSFDLPNSSNCCDSSKGGVIIPFPMKLHEMLKNTEEEGLASIVTWQPHGRAFRVIKPTEFVERIMPKYFRQSKISSFQRQLNLYGFRRITKGLDTGCYYNELFLRGKPWLSYRMFRTRVKGTGVRTASSPDTEPNFYKMQPVYRHIPENTQSQPEYSDFSRDESTVSVIKPLEALSNSALDYLDPFDDNYEFHEIDESLPVAADLIAQNFFDEPNSEMFEFSDGMRLCNGKEFANLFRS